MRGARIDPAWFGPRGRSLSVLLAGFGLSVEVVPRGSPALPIWLRTARGLRWPCTYERTCVFICACECSPHVYSTVPVRGLGMGCVLPTGRMNCAWVAVAMNIMNGHACSFVRVSAVRMCTIPVLGLGMTAYSLPGGVYGQNLYWDLCTTFSRVYVQYVVRLGQCEQCTLYVYVCVYGGRHVQPERCTTHREYVYACFVQYMAWWPGRRA